MSSKAEVRPVAGAVSGERTAGMPGNLRKDASRQQAAVSGTVQPASELFKPGNPTGGLIPSAALESSGATSPGARRVATAEPITSVFAEEDQAEGRAATPVYAAGTGSGAQDRGTRAARFVAGQPAETVPGTPGQPPRDGGGRGRGGEFREQGDDGEPVDEILEKLKWVTKKDIDDHAASVDKGHFATHVRHRIFDPIEKDPTSGDPGLLAAYAAVKDKARLEYEPVDPDEPRSLDKKISLESLARAVREAEKDVVEKDGPITAIPGVGETLTAFLKHFVEKRETLIDLREDVLLHQHVLAGAEERRRADNNLQNSPTRIANSMRERVLLADAERKFTEEYEGRKLTQEERSREHTKVFLQGIYPDDPRIDDLPPEQATSLAGNLVSVYRNITGWGDAEHDADNAVAYLNGSTIEEILAGDNDIVEERTIAGLKPIAGWLHLENSRGTIGETRLSLTDILEVYLQDAGFDPQEGRPVVVAKEAVQIVEHEEEPEDPIDVALRLVTEEDLDAFAAHSLAAGENGIVAERVKQQLFGIPRKIVADPSPKAQREFKALEDAGLKLQTGKIPWVEGEPLSIPYEFASLKQVVANERVTEIPELTENDADFLRAFVEYRENLIKLRSDVVWYEETVAGHENYVQEADKGTKQRVDRLRELIENQILKGTAERDFKEAQNFDEPTPQEMLAKEHVTTFLSAILRGHPAVADLPEDRARDLAQHLVNLYKYHNMERSGWKDIRAAAAEKYLAGAGENYDIANAIGHIGEWLHKYRGEGKTGSDAYDLTRHLQDYLPVPLEELSPAERARRTKDVLGPRPEIPRVRGERLEVPALELSQSKFRGREKFSDNSQLAVDVTFVEERRRVRPGARVNVHTDVYQFDEREYVVQPVEVSMDFRPDSPIPRIAELGELADLGESARQVVAEAAAQLALDTVNAMTSSTGERPGRGGREQPVYRGRNLTPAQVEVNRTARELDRAQTAAAKEKGTEKYAHKAGVAIFRELLLENAKLAVPEEVPSKEPLDITHIRTLLRNIYGNDERVAVLDQEQAKALMQNFIDISSYGKDHIPTELQAVQLYAEGKTLSEIQEQTQLSQTKIAWHVGAFVASLHTSDYQGRLSRKTANWMIDAGMTDDYWMGHNVFEYLLQQQIQGEDGSD